MLNQIMLIGYLGKDAELIQKEGSKSFLAFSLAVNDNSDDKKTEWFDVVYYPKEGSTLIDYLKKGTMVAVSGKPYATAFLDKNSTPIGKINISGYSIKLLTEKK